jgi:hypothetical protein
MELVYAILYVFCVLISPKLKKFLQSFFYAYYITRALSFCFLFFQSNPKKWQKEILPKIYSNFFSCASEVSFNVENLNKIYNLLKKSNNLEQAKKVKMYIRNHGLKEQILTTFHSQQQQQIPMDDVEEIDSHNATQQQQIVDDVEEMVPHINNEPINNDDAMEMVASDDEQQINDEFEEVHGHAMEMVVSDDEQQINDEFEEDGHAIEMVASDDEQQINDESSDDNEMPDADWFQIFSLKLKKMPI